MENHSNHKAMDFTSLSDLIALVHSMDWDRGLAFLYEQLPQWHRSPAFLFELALHYYRGQQLLDAAAAFRQVIDMDPSFAAAKECYRNVIHAMFDRWHYRMLNDHERNKAYGAALSMAISTRPERPVVLDIGSGTGLLSMLACDAGAKHCFGCEGSPVMAKIAQATLKANGYGRRVTILPFLSTEVSVTKGHGGEKGFVLPQSPHSAKASGPAPILPVKADVIVSEILDSGLLGERVLPSLRHAVQHLLAPDGICIPAFATVYVQCIECEALRRQSVPAAQPLGTPATGPLPNPRVCDLYTCEQLGRMHHRALTKPVPLVTIRFDNSGSSPSFATGPKEAEEAKEDCAPEASASSWVPKASGPPPVIPLRFTEVGVARFAEVETAGVIDGVILWFDLRLLDGSPAKEGESTTLTTAPPGAPGGWKGGARPLVCNWDQALYYCRVVTPRQAKALLSSTGVLGDKRTYSAKGVEPSQFPIAPVKVKPGTSVRVHGIIDDDSLGILVEPPFAFDLGVRLEDLGVAGGGKAAGEAREAFLPVIPLAEKSMNAWNDDVRVRWFGLAIAAAMEEAEARHGAGTLLLDMNLELSLGTLKASMTQGFRFVFSSVEDEGDRGAIKQLVHYHRLPGSVLNPEVVEEVGLLPLLQKEGDETGAGDEDMAGAVSQPASSEQQKSALLLHCDVVSACGLLQQNVLPTLDRAKDLACGFTLRRIGLVIRPLSSAELFSYVHIDATRGAAGKNMSAIERFATDTFPDLHLDQLMHIPLGPDVIVELPCLATGSKTAFSSEPHHARQRIACSIKRGGELTGFAYWFVMEACGGGPVFSTGPIEGLPSGVTAVRGHSFRQAAYVFQQPRPVSPGTIQVLVQLEASTPAFSVIMGEQGKP